MSTRPLAVIDTNVALDLLVFEDARCGMLRDAVANGRLAWIASPAMRGELAIVLERGFGSRWPVDVPRVLQTWDRWTSVRPEPVAGPLRCSDPDDQKFIDLAMVHGSCWLLTRDRALLRLARRARERAVEVRAPGDWMQPALG